MVSAYQLDAGDVVIVSPGDIRTVHHVTPTGVDQYALTNITFSDGRHTLCSPTRDFHRLYPPDASDQDPTS